MNVSGATKELVQVNSELSLYTNIRGIRKNIKNLALIELELNKVIDEDVAAVIKKTDAIIDSLFVNYRVVKYCDLRYFVFSDSNNFSAFKVTVDSKILTASSILDSVLHQTLLTVKFSDVLEDDFASFVAMVEFISNLKLNTNYSKLDVNFDAILNSYKVALLESTVETEQHCGRCSYYNKRIAQKMDLSIDEISKSNALGWLHDIGKIAIEDAILNKPARLDDTEWVRMVEHPTIGWKILRDIPGFAEIAEGVKYHHERFDGKGYPNRLSGRDIPMISRIMSVTDSFDTMLSKRSYKEPMTLEYAVSELLENKCKQFDPYVVDVFVGLIQAGEFNRIIASYSDK